MKVSVNLSIDADIFNRFTNAVKNKDATLEEVTEELFSNYADKNNFYVSVTEKFIFKCEEKYAVGQLANIILRGLLERGVAAQDEITEMQKASGQLQVKNFKTFHGNYCKDNFKIAFPLLVDEQRFQINKNIFYNQPLRINGEKFHLCSQWNKIHFEPIKNWIRSHLPKWLDNATLEQRKDMENFINQA